jgi:hypothetical protein
MSIKYSKILNYKTLLNIPKWKCLVRKNAVWEPRCEFQISRKGKKLNWMQPDVNRAGKSQFHQTLQYVGGLLVVKSPVEIESGQVIEMFQNRDSWHENRYTIRQPWYKMFVKKAHQQILHAFQYGALPSGVHTHIKYSWTDCLWMSKQRFGTDSLENDILESLENDSLENDKSTNSINQKNYKFTN